MATINSLRTSITEMQRPELFALLNNIRAIRRTRPERKQKAAPAKVARAPKKSNLKQQDIFSYTNGLSQANKDKLAAELLKGLLG